MLEDQIRQIRETLGAVNDSDLAAKLGITRTAIARWKARGVIPPEYRYLASSGTSWSIPHAVQFITHRRVYSHADNHYWLRAALQVLPADYGYELPPEQRAELLEFVLTRLIDAAADATVRELGKPRCESSSDYRALIDALLTGTDSKTGSRYADRIARVLSEGIPDGTPQ